MLSNYRSDRSQSVSAGVSGSYNHPAGVAKAIKGEVKKKHHSSGWISSCFAAHLFEQDRFGPSAPDARLLDDVVTRLGLSLPAFHRFLRRSRSVPRPTKPNRGQMATIVLFLCTSMPIYLALVIRAFLFWSGYGQQPLYFAAVISLVTLPLPSRN
jgi:hypothetical protein